MCETVVPHLGETLDADGEIARRVLRATHAMAPTKRTAVVPQPPVHGIDVGTIDDSERATMATAVILPHLTLPAIGRKLAYWGSADASGAGSHCVNARARPIADSLLPPSYVSLISAIISISTQAPNGTCATLTALRAWMPRSPNT